MSPQKFNKNLKITIKLCSCLHNEDLRIKGVNNMAEFLLVNGQINYLNLGYTKWRFLITMPLLVQPAESSVTRWEQWHLLQGTTYCTFLKKGVLMHRRIFEFFFDWDCGHTKHHRALSNIFSLELHSSQSLKKELLLAS